MSGQPTAPPISLENATETKQLSIADLDGEHRHLLIRAITRILLTELAKITYAQIVDGLPIADVAYDSRVQPYKGHPIDHSHEDLCPGMLDKAQEFYRNFQPEVLTFRSQVRLIPQPFYPFFFLLL